MRTICGLYLRERSEMIHWRSTTSNNTARKKCLQITTFMAVRSMRAILCGESFALAVKQRKRTNVLLWRGRLE
jgi:hypothetical protein